MDQSFIPECFVDTNLIETLVPPVQRYNHQKGCGTVAKVMKERFADRFAVGIIDKDKHAIDYLREFDAVFDNGSLLLHKHKTRHHYMIQVSPAMERFILANAAAVNIDLRDYGLPTGLTELKKESKQSTSKDDWRFRQLFGTLDAAGAPDIQRLKKWITYLREKSYQVNLPELLSF